MKKFERILVIIVLFTVIIGTYAAGLSRQYAIPIIRYQDIRESEDPKSALGVSLANFEYQMAFLNKQKYRVISLDDLVEAIANNQTLPRNSVVLTFDGGLMDHYEQAFPVLKKYGFPATFFLVTDHMDKPGYLTWQQVKEMEQHKVVIGSLTLSQGYLPELPEARVEREIKNSKRVIERRIGRNISHFAYPNGGFTSRAKQFVKEAGYQSASTTSYGDRVNQNVYELNRIPLSDQDRSAIGLWMKFSGYYNFFEKYDTVYKYK